MSFFDLSLDWANRIYAWGWRSSVVGAVITALGVGLLMWGTRVRDRDFEEQVAVLHEKSAAAEERSKILDLAVAAANERAAHAGLRTAELTLALEQEQTKRASRKLTDEQKNLLIKALTGRVEPLSIIARDEDEPRQYADQFINSLREANLLDVQVPYILTISPVDNWTGIRLYIPRLMAPEAFGDDPLVKAFTAAGIPITGISSGSQSGVVLDPKLTLPRRTIYIGHKPLPD